MWPSSSGVSTWPCTSTRSRASTTQRSSRSGRRMWRSNSLGRVWVPMRSRSAKPSVMTSATASPRRSSSALVATVVPILTLATRAAGIGSPGCRPRTSRMPWMAASSVRSGCAESSLRVRSSPCGESAITSVKVPPRSIQKCQAWSGMVFHPGISSGSKDLLFRGKEAKSFHCGCRGLLRRHVFSPAHPTGAISWDATSTEVARTALLSVGDTGGPWLFYPVLRRAESKACFFEEKQQKTFVSPVAEVTATCALGTGVC